ncbi:hypothetical protein F4823DRAFT_639048, partial [Ustulina deusta]
LTETYCRVLQRIKSRGHRKEAKKIFPWIAASKQLLSLSQLREAIAIEIGQQYSKPERLYNDMKNIALWCENLVQIDEEYQLVQFAHSTIRKFLIEKPLDSTLAEFYVNLEEVDHDIGERCVTYLNFNDFKTTVARRIKPMLLHDPAQIAQSALGDQSKSASLLAKLRLKSASKPVDISSVQSRTEKGSSTAHENLALGYPFLDYASNNWVLHTREFQPEISKTWRLWENMVIYGHNLAKLPWGEDTFNPNGRILTWAHNAHHYALIRLIASSDKLSEYEKVRIIRFSVKDNDVFTLNILLEGQDLSSEMRDLLETATENGHLEVVERLLAAGADVNAFPTGAFGRTALQAAAENGHLEVVERLLSAGADVNAFPANKFGVTALQAAAENGHLEVIERLLSAGADITAVPDNWESPITWKVAAGKSHLEVAQMLIDAKVRTSTTVDPKYIDMLRARVQRS